MSKKKFNFDDFIKEHKSTTAKSQGKRPLRQRILIVCEGEKTEPHYFESFKMRLPKGMIRNIVIEGQGMNTTSLVNAATRKVKDSNDRFDQVWIVFDRDSFTANHVNTACSRCDQLGYKIAFSNEAFELWYILHFEYLDAKITRSDYIIKLNKIFKKLGIASYKKNQKEIYTILQNHGDQSKAIANAKRLATFHTNVSPSDSKPSTSVYLLVEELNQYIIV